MSAAAAQGVDDAWNDKTPGGPRLETVKPGAVLPDDEAETLSMIATLQQAADISDTEIDLIAGYQADLMSLQLRHPRALAGAKMARVKRALGDRKAGE